MDRAHVLETSLVIGRARRDVFRFFADPENLEAITPRDLRFEILTPPAPAPDLRVPRAQDPRVAGVPDLR
jgi:hypothetical protein